MRHIRAYLATEDPVTPQALEILSKVKAEVIGDSVTIDFLPAHDRLPNGATVFALGKYRAENPSVRVVPAPSVGTIVSHAGIVTRLGQAFQLLVQPPELPEFQYKILNLSQAINFLSRRDSVFAYDLEWSGDDDEPNYSRLLGAGFYDGTRAYVIPEHIVQTAVVHDALKGFLEGNAVVTVNGKGDLSYTPHARVPVESHFDCMLAHYALWPTLEHGLKPVTKHMFGFDDWDEATKPYRKGATYDAYEKFEDGSWHDARTYSNGSGFERIPRAMLYEYLGFDVYAAWHWFVRMREMLAADEDAMKAFKFLMRLSDMFMDVEARGIRLDVEYLETLSTTLQIEKTFAEIDLNKIAGKEINPRSPKQVKEWFAGLGVELPSTNEATLKEFIEETDEREDCTPKRFAQQILVCRALTKTLGTYVDGYRNQADENGYVYPGYKLSTSTTGRLGGRGASMLTIPREKRLKRMVVADPGMVMVGADLSQAELRVMAVESMDQWLIDAFQPGAGDFFDLLLGQAYPDIDWVALHKKVSDHEATEDEANFYNNKRASMKGVVYGVSFGRGVKAIAAALKISIAEAQRLVDAFVRPGSAFALWREDISRKALAGEGIVTKFGRHFQSELVTRVNRQNVINSALSFTSQSTANDICLLATLEVVKQLPDYGYRLMGTVHDAIYTTGPAENKEVVGKLLTESLAWAGREVYGELVPFDADWGYGESMADI